MPATIELKGIRATVPGYEGEYEEKWLLRLLKSVTNKNELSVGGHLKNPDPDIALASDLAKRWKGRVIEETPTPDPKLGPGWVV